MSVCELTVKMVEYARGELHDISHFMKVLAYAKTIGECEGLDADTRKTLEIAALIHDIACPLCRQKYGSTIHKRQEEEGMLLAAEFLRDAALPKSMTERIIYLVGHHHTLTDVDGMDHRILLEADFLTNAEEKRYEKKQLTEGYNAIFRTQTGKSLFRALFGDITKP